MTQGQREALITKLINDMVSSARQDSGFGGDFIEDAMRNGYEPLSEKSDEVLLQWHRDCFDEEFQP